MPFDISNSHYPMLTAMLAPALFLTATGSLLLNANNRLARISDRLRQELAHLIDNPGPRSSAIRNALLRRRAHTVLAAIRMLHLALCSFVATSLTIGLESVIGSGLKFVPSGLAVVGVTLMLGGGVQLWREANMAVRSLDLMLAEHDERLRAGESH
jgi:hypothetical protein